MKKTAARTPVLRLARADRPPRSVMRDLFLVWRMPRCGVTNPHRLTNPAWSWLARRRTVNAYMANAHFDGPSSLLVGPCWCCNRFGQSVTELPDGRTVLIAGEHEDHYDPDFYIYNDVIVVSPKGQVEIYGYPYEVFPPTDFHSATRVDDRIVILGCLGHPSQRVPDATPAFALDTGTLAITRLNTTGSAPGWIYSHEATLSGDRRSITVRGGKRVELADGAERICENIDEWSLDLEALAWTRLTDRRWPRWELLRADGQRNHLLTIEWMSWNVGGNSPFAREQMETMQREVGWLPDFALYASRYTPPIEHEKLPDGEEYPKVVRIVVEGVTVRYVETDAHVRVTVEGTLAQEKIDALVEDARRKLGEIERSPYEAQPLYV